ncbi:gliding motility protein RemB [Flavobacterium silvaticum]|uniref:Capsule assembly Wzi family protein n=1 Tax=Flavobacterium silvaticum TaxID=1852020 RepID=A0A972JEP0_9FLAO|nr:gliding motility protein RemB [Flavobacterium silvaticum]NMH27104.1 capsule assembly Wzi family protein [Flavobacterium silvaticum]
MRKIYAVLLICSFLPVFAQTQRAPVYPGCESENEAQREACFYNKVQQVVFESFKVPQDVAADYSGMATVLFEVTDKGEFKVLFVDSDKPSVAEESKRVFATLPKVSPATFNGKTTYQKYTLRIAIPLVDPKEMNVQDLSKPVVLPSGMVQPKPKKPKIDHSKELAEFDSVAKTYKKWDNPQFRSHLNIPFSHSYYAQFDDAMNQIGANNHTASKPYAYADVNRYYNLETAYQKIAKNKTGWWGRKLWNESTVQIQGEDYWFTLNPILDLQLGKSSSDKVDNTFVNTRGIRLEGGLGENINFTTTIYESQGRFADYYNAYAESIKPSGGNPAIIPGMGIAKGFKDDAYDFPLAEANLSYTPAKFLNLNLGYGRNFIGDGYRSLLLGDGVSPYPYFKINTTFWKIKYTNVYTWLKDVRPEATVDGTYATKFSAAHYLSLNLTKRWNIGFFESVVWARDENRGFDMSFINPIIFYRSVEFASSSKSGNALLALTTKYKFTNQFNFYAQYLLDEFSLADMKSGDKSWKNKFGYQLGLKYFNAFDIDHLTLQMEYNRVRPYVYSHSDPITNYGHNNQSLGHNWGSNFQELLVIARYNYGRYFADVKFTFGQRGFDFDTSEDSYNYGSNIYKNYTEGRPYDTGVKVGQGNRADVFFTDIQAGYLVNPATNLKLYASFIYRSFEPKTDTALVFGENTAWFSIGLRSDVFNWYFDY